ncbi:MAG: zf-HC2 domain-containing protein [Acidobacteria bacterium]|nr:zf-HC2 domain-containing protein [Acidobacteriota bacterium]
MSCSEFDALISQAIDGTLAGERLAGFEAHRRECTLCGPLVEDAERGRFWVKSLAEVEPPQDLVTAILLRTAGVVSAQRHLEGRRQAISWTRRLKGWGRAVLSPVVAVARQPRFAMSFGMAFFTLSVTLSLTGVRLADLRQLDLRPSAIRRTYYETTGRVVKYYENIRFYYEIESTVRQFKEATTPAEPPQEHQNKNNKDRKDKSKNNTSGQPGPRQERNYSREGSQPVLASLDGRIRAHEPPGVSVATSRRVV